MEEELYEEIESYATNQMSEEERKAFEYRLNDDATLREKVELYLSVSQSLTSDAQMKDQSQRLEAMLKSMRPKAKQVSWFRYIGYAAAASVLIAMVVWFAQRTETPTYLAYAKYEPLALTERSGADSMAMFAEQYFNSKEYAKALPYIDSLLKHNPENSELMLYKAIVLIETNNYESANPLLDSLRESPSVFREKALWIRSLSALKQNDLMHCRELLKEIGPEHEDYESAKELLDALD